MVLQRKKLSPSRERERRVEGYKVGVLVVIRGSGRYWFQWGCGGGRGFGTRLLAKQCRRSQNSQWELLFTLHFHF